MLGLEEYELSNLVLSNSGRIIFLLLLKTHDPAPVHTKPLGLLVADALTHAIEAKQVHIHVVLFEKEETSC